MYRIRRSYSVCINSLAIQSTGEIHKKTLMQREDLQHPGCFCPEMIPAPDYSDSEEDLRRDNSTENGIIVPKKLPNPCVESKDRVNLHKELMFNQKIGKNVLNQKSELQRAMQKFQDDHKKKEVEQEQLTSRTSLEKKLEEQANKLKEAVVEDQMTSIPQSEFQRIHAKVRARMDSQ